MVYNSIYGVDSIGNYWARGVILNIIGVEEYREACGEALR